MRPVRMNSERLRGGYSLLELLTVVATVCILAVVLFPIFARAKSGGFQNPWCASNLGRLAIAEKQYAEDYDGVFQCYYFSAPGVPAAPTWRQVLYPYTRTMKVYNCPNRSARWFNNGNSFNWHLQAFPKNAVKKPSNVVLFCDSDVDDNTGLQDDAIGWADDFHPAHSNMMRVHGNKANIAFVAGNVKLVDPGVLRLRNFAPTD